MKFLFRRKYRIAFCGVIALLAAAFFYWDAVGMSGKPTWTPGPQYLVCWLAAVLAGGAALAGLMIESCLSVWRQVRSRAELPPIETPGQWVPRS